MAIQARFVGKCDVSANPRCTQIDPPKAQCVLSVIVFFGPSGRRFRATTLGPALYTRTPFYLKTNFQVLDSPFDSYTDRFGIPGNVASDKSVDHSNLLHTCRVNHFFIFPESVCVSYPSRDSTTTEPLLECKISRFWPCTTDR